METRKMGLSIVANPNQISTAINSFNPLYHEDYFRVRTLAAPYLAAAPIAHTAQPLAAALHDVLGRWGAEIREAPRRRSVDQITVSLTTPQLHRHLSEFAHLSPTSLGFNATGTREIANIGAITLANFDARLLETLNTLARVLFSDNTNVTYPMKALLLVTGFMPAFDGQVKRGLGRAGFTGTNKTQYLLPQDARQADGKKICAFPFYMGQCFNNHADLIQRAVGDSRYPQLITEIGRIFDVLFFVQQDPALPQLLDLQPPVRSPWYGIV